MSQCPGQLRSGNLAINIFVFNSFGGVFSLFGSLASTLLHPAVLQQGIPQLSSRLDEEVSLF